MLDHINQFKVNYLAMHSNRVLENKCALEVQKLTLTERVKAVALEILAILGIVFSLGNQDWKNVARELFAQVQTGLVYKSTLLPADKPAGEQISLSSENSSQTEHLSALVQEQRERLSQPSSSAASSDAIVKATSSSKGVSNSAGASTLYKTTSPSNGLMSTFILTSVTPEEHSKLPQKIQRFRNEVEEIISEGQTPLNEVFLRRLAELVLKYCIPYSKWNRQYYPMGNNGRDTNYPSETFKCLEKQLTPQVQDLLFYHPCIKSDKVRFLTSEEMSLLISAYPPQHSFLDHEIIEVIAAPGECRPDGKKPIFQLGQRASSFATVSMIASDVLEEAQTTLSNMPLCNDLLNYLRGRSLEPIVSSVNSLEELQAKIEEHGCSAHVSMFTGGATAVVVDRVVDDRVEVRDPYHGWAVSVKKEAFLRYFNQDGKKTDIDIIQARKN